MDRNNTREEDRSLLNSALETIVNEISDIMEEFPSFTYPESQGYTPDKYIVRLAGIIKDIAAEITKEKAEKKYLSFRDYFEDTRLTLTSPNAHLGKKALKNQELYSNFVNYAGFKLTKTRIRETAKLIEEIGLRIDRYNSKYKQKIHFLEKESIDSEKISLDARDAAYDIFLRPEVIKKIRKYTRFDKQPLQIYLKR